MSAQNSSSKNLHSVLSSSSGIPTMADDHNSYRLDLSQPSDKLRLLDDIDELRSHGISSYISLPQLVVCGDQSSGKSSVLEAISGIPFPTKDNLCTSFATEVILRRTPKTSNTTVSVALIPHATRSESDRLKFKDFRETPVDFKDFLTLIGKAKDLMGVSGAGSAFFSDVLRVEVSGPDQPHLTIVDLPGLIHSANKIQTAQDVNLVSAMVQSYMENRRSIILAVVSAKNDYANQIVLAKAKKSDPGGARTLGVITKPDTLPAGSDSERAFISLARNEDIRFHHGWHVVRNRDYESRESSKESRDRTENEFFSQGVWNDLPRDRVGITALRDRLSKLLLNQIKTELPSLAGDILASLEKCKEELSKMGESRETDEEQRLFLLRISQAFQALLRMAIEGTYGDPFFGDPLSDEGCQKHLRAVIQNLNIKFAKSMRERGHRRKIVDESDSIGPTTASLSEDANSFPIPEVVARDDFIDEIQQTLKRSKGRELPGMFNPLRIGNLFHEHSRPWEDIARRHLYDTWDATRAFFELAMSHLTDEATSEALLQEILDPAMEEKRKKLDDKLDELLAPHQRGHPITYDDYFTETLQKVRGQRSKKDIENRVVDFFGQKDNLTKESTEFTKINALRFISVLPLRNEADMERYACSEILDCMEAYYEVSMKTFIDNVTVQAVEGTLIAGLGNLLSPAVVMQMKTDILNNIAAESREKRAEREQLSRKSEVLRKGLETCNKHIGRTAKVAITRKKPQGAENSRRVNSTRAQQQLIESSKPNDSTKTASSPVSNATASESSSVLGIFRTPTPEPASQRPAFRTSRAPTPKSAPKPSAFGNLTPVSVHKSGNLMPNSFAPSNPNANPFSFTLPTNSSIAHPTEPFAYHSDI